MKRLKGGTSIFLLLTISLMSLIFVPAVSAVASITYFFQDQSASQVQNVQTEVFTCQDADCTSVNSVFRQSKNSSFSNINIIDYPTVLQSQYGYALYHYATCFIPKSFVATWAGSGSTSVTNRFDKIQSCQASISNFSYSPSSIRAGVQMQFAADISSAFSDLGHPPRYIPEGFENFYSSLTDINFEIRDSSNRIVSNQSLSSSIFMDTAKSSLFSWTPDKKGTYTAVLSTSVPDCQCSGTITRSRQVTFDVSNTPPVLDLIQNRTIFENQSVSLIVSGHDDDNDSLVFSASALPPGSSFNQVSGEFSWQTDFDDAGVYVITFKVQDQQSQTTRKATIRVLDVNRAPTAVVAASPVSGRFPLLVQFDGALSTDPDNDPLTFSWSYGDGSPISSASSSAVSSHTYASPGSYRTTLTVSDPGGLSDQDNHLIINVLPNQPPSVIASVNQSVGLAPLSVRLSAVGFDDVGIVNYSWDFGDGSSVMQGQSVLHTYPVGTFIATVTAFDTDGASASNTTGPIVVVADLSPSASVVANVTSGLSPLSVSLSCSGSGGNSPLSYHLSFGDGSPSTTSATPISVSHTYFASVPSVYNPVCSVSDADNDVVIRSLNISVVPDSVPSLSCSAAPVSGLAPLDVVFNSSIMAGSGNPPFQFLWDFGDSASVSGQNVVHTYGPGVYSAVLNVTDVDGDIVSCRPSSVGVVADLSPSASVVANVTSGLSPLSVSLSCSGSGGNAPLSYFVEFGDGSSTPVSSVPLSVSHVYSSSSVARCVVTDSDGDMNSSSVAINLTGDTSPVVSCSVAQTVVQAGQSVGFNATASGGNPPLSFLWDFGDNSYSSALNPLHAYTSVGNYSAAFTATDFDSDSAVCQLNISVITIPPANLPPIVNISSIPKSGFVPLAVQFASTASDPDGVIVSYSWNFGDGTVSSVAQPAHIYSAPGIYNATLTVQDDDAATASDSLIVTVNQSLALNVSALSCFPLVMESAVQTCVVVVQSNGTAIQNASVQLFNLSDASLFGACTTSPSGSCSISYPAGRAGNYSVYATASRPGFVPDSDNQPMFDYGVIVSGYDIVNLATYNDSLFAMPDSVFFRNQSLFVRFFVRHNVTGAPVEGIISSASLISPPGGQLNLTKVSEGSGYYSFSGLIPPTHQFLGNSHVFAVAFNTSDGSAGQATVNLSILNNPPEIRGVLPIVFNEDTMTSIDLSAFEADIEDSGSNLQWSAVSGNPLVFSAAIAGNILTLTGMPDAAGNSTVLLTLTDLDSDSDSAIVNVSVVPVNDLPTITVDLTPNSPLTTADLVCTGVVQDPELQPVSASYVFSGAYSASGSATCSGNICTASVPASATTRGDVVICSMTPHDPLGSGSPAQDSVTILNSAPIASVALSPANPLLSDNLTCSATISDADNDAVTAQYVLSGARTSSGSMVCAGAVCSVNIPGPFQPNASLACAVTPFDGSDLGPVVQDTVNFPSSGVGLAVSIIPKPAFTTDNLTCLATVPQNTSALQYSWYLNGSLTNYSSNVISGLLTSSSDVWTCRVTAFVPFVGTQSASDNITISNSVPRAALTIFPSSPVSSDNVSCGIVASDPDYDGVVVNYSIIINRSGSSGVLSGSLPCSGNCSLLVSSAYTMKSDVIMCSAIPVDSKGLAGTQVSSSVTIADSAPSLIGISVTPSAPMTNDTLHCSAIASDPDNDSVSITYSWVSSAGHSVSGRTVSSSLTARGQLWTCTASAVNSSLSASLVVGNNPPNIVSTPITTLTLDSINDPTIEYMYQVVAVDPDNDSLTYSLDIAPSGMVITSTGLIKWNPTRHHEGSNLVLVRVSDGLAFDLQQYDLSVFNPQEVNTAREKIFIDSLYIPTLCILPGEDAYIYVAFTNTGYYKMDDARITATIPDLGLFASAGPDSLDPEESMSRVLYLQVPEDAPEGLYDVRVSAGNDYYRRYRHREIQVKSFCEASCYDSCG